MPKSISKTYTPYQVDKELWIKELKKNNYKYFVVKTEEFLESLSDEEVEQFDIMLQKYNERRKKEGKVINSYWVVNRDEPYADKVKNLMGL